jgi:hypothetical protein
MEKLPLAAVDIDLSYCIASIEFFYGTGQDLLCLQSTHTDKKKHNIN